ncbi:MAG: cell wall anchor protein [Chryseobacterium sp.]|nr:cell wall anchor protein [Chryseobacterium sp.]
MSETLMSAIGVFLASMATGFGGWFFGRKKANAEAETSQIENAEKLLNYYKNIVDDLGGRLEVAIENLQKSEAEKQEAIRQLNEARSQMLVFEKTVEKLTEEIKKYKQLNGKSE